MTVLVTGASGFVGRHLLAGYTGSGQRVLALLRRPEKLPDLRERVAALGGKADLVEGITGDLDLPALGLDTTLPPLDAVVHLGAAFGWGLEPQTARRTNVSGALSVAELAYQHGTRLVMTSGFMLENARHLQWLGIVPDAPEQTRWDTVYAKAGAYEASKLEGALRVRAFAHAQQLDYVEVQPATVSGHSESGELDPEQPLFGLIDNLGSGRLSLVPGGPDYWLPLVSVDALATLIRAASLAEQVPERLLALDPATPNLAGLLAEVAQVLGRRPPKRHIPIKVLGALLKIPGLAGLMNTAPESLHFLQPVRFDTQASEAFRQQEGVEWRPIREAIRKTAEYWRENSA
ncbi:MAG: SDR family oxidoreductase [Ectothiorhodospiraceae bacterium]|nr:SDR family oxidoreductase [Ectothiorhodospiraceae bacterium]